MHPHRPKQNVFIWPLGKVMFTYPIILVWVICFLLKQAGIDSPWFARASFLSAAFVIMIVFIDVRRNLAMIAFVIAGLVLTIVFQAVGFGVFKDLAGVLERYGTGYPAEFNLLLAIQLLLLMAFDLADCFLNRRIRFDDQHIELLQPGEGQKLYDLNQVIVEYKLTDYWEWLLLGTGTISVYSKNGSDKGMLILRLEHVRRAKSVYDKIQSFINAS